MSGFYFLFLQIFLSAGLLKFSFMEVFKKSSYINGINEAGEQVLENLSHSFNMIDALSAAGYSVLGIALVISLGVSAVMAVLNLFLSEVKVVRVGGRILFGVSVVLFVVCFLIAAKTGSHL